MRSSGSAQPSENFGSCTGAGCQKRRPRAVFVEISVRFKAQGYQNLLVACSRKDHAGA